MHGDLAIRNVLLDKGYVAKISDFGLAKSISYYNIGKMICACLDNLKHWFSLHLLPCWGSGNLDLSRGEIITPAIRPTNNQQHLTNILVKFIDIGNCCYLVVVTVGVRGAAMIISSSYQLWQLIGISIFRILRHCPHSIPSSSDNHWLAQVNTAGPPVTIL